MKLLNVLYQNLKVFKEKLDFDVFFNKKETVIGNTINKYDLGFKLNMLNKDIVLDEVEINQVDSNVDNDVFFKDEPCDIKKHVKFLKRKIIVKCLLIFFLTFTVCGENIYEGIDLYTKKIKTETGNHVFHLVKIKKSDLYRFRVVLSDFRLLHREVLTDISKKYNALVAINGAYFHNNGQPLGTIILNHKIVSLPVFKNGTVYKRSVFCITDDNNYFITTPDIVPRVHYMDEIFDVNGINQITNGNIKEAEENAIFIYTPEFGRNTGTEKTGREYSIIKDKVVEIFSKNAIIPPDGYVIRVSGDTYIKKFGDLQFGSSIKMDITLDDSMKKVKYAIGSGPRLIKDGKISVTSTEEKFKPNLVYQKAPRSAIAIDYEDNIILITLDGRLKGYSEGMSLKEFAEYINTLNVKHAMNLDGGGSSTLVINNELRNKPSDGSQRKINGAIILEKN